MCAAKTWGKNLSSAHDSVAQATAIDLQSARKSSIDMLSSYAIPSRLRAERRKLYCDRQQRQRNGPA